MSMPVTSEYNNAMREFTDLSYTTSEQHKECTEARIQRDISDLAKIRSKLTACTPFSPDPSLRNIINGVVASSDVNVHEYEAVGRKIIGDMIGQPAFTFPLKRKDKAKTLGDASTVKIDPEKTIDPALLFQRFLVVSKTGDLSLQDVMSYELSPFPPSLFEARDVFRKADKPQLAHAITDYAMTTSSEAILDTAPRTEHYVLDGGSLLHRVPWHTGETYGAIAHSYADFTIRHYGKATVVFDGYKEASSIKDNTHQRRGHNVHPTIRFTTDTEFVGKKEEFLSRDSNKQNLIDLISNELTEMGCNVINAPGDADVDIVKAAVESSHRQPTTLVGEDTDLLILLLHYASIDNMDLYSRSDNTSRGMKVYNIKKLIAALGKDVCSRLVFTSHCLRTYYQIMVWMGSECDMDVTSWGWKREDNHLVPLMSNKDAAPAGLLKMVHCNCSTACRTARCSCRGYGLPCHSVCGQCQVETCYNPNNTLVDVDQDEEQ